MASKQRYLSYNALVGTIHITDDDGSTGYYLDRAGEGAWTFTKIIGREERHVTLSPDGNKCDCPGHRRWGHKTVCRHIGALLALRSRGRI